MGYKRYWFDEDPEVGKRDMYARLEGKRITVWNDPSRGDQIQRARGYYTERMDYALYCGVLKFRRHVIGITLFFLVVLVAGGYLVSFHSSFQNSSWELQYHSVFAKLLIWVAAGGPTYDGVIVAMVLAMFGLFVFLPTAFSILFVPAIARYRYCKRYGKRLVVDKTRRIPPLAMPGRWRGVQVMAGVVAFIFVAVVLIGLVVGASAGGHSGDSGRNHYI